MGWPELFSFARDRHCVVTVGDAIAHEVSEGALRRRATSDGWPLLFPGVWLIAGAAETDRARLLAATLAYSGHAAVESAMWLHGLREDAPRTPHVLVEHARHGTRRTGVEVRRTRTLRDGDLVEVDGISATDIVRTLIDIAPRRTRRRLRGHVIDAERDGLLERGQLATRLESLRRGVPALGRIRGVVADLSGLTSDSDTEHDVRRALIDLGYPVHPAPFPFRCDDDVTVELDLALPQYWVYLEMDGFGTHTRRSVFEGDRRKWTQLVRQWRPVWVTAERWRLDRDGVLADLDAAIADADPTRPAATSAA